MAEPGSTVSIYLGLKHLGEVIVAKDGTWSYTLTTPLKDGDYNITATATDIAGHTSETVSLPFTIDTVSAISALRLKRLMIAVLSEITLLIILAQPLPVKLSQMLLLASEIVRQAKRLLLKQMVRANGHSISLQTQLKGLTTLHSLLKMLLATKRIFLLVTL